jgi:putative ribosome biogenesis GTPase RsgA
MFDQQFSVSTMNLMNNETTSIIDQFIKVIAQQTISSAETIARQYLQKVIDEKQKILNNRDKFQKPPSVDTIITSIENRQNNMIQRMQYNIEQQLKTLLANPYSSS